MSRKSFPPAIVLILTLLFSIGCNLLTGTSQPQQMGTIKVVNTHVRGSDAFPGGRGLPDAREYGVCIITYPPVAGLTKPTFDMILAKDGGETTYALPAGVYIVQEWQFDSEINDDPLYSPAMKTYVRPVETIVLEADETIVFGSERTLPQPGDFVEGNPINPNCGGAAAGPGVFPTNTPETSSEEEFFAVRSIGAAFNGATAPTTFAIDDSWLVTLIITYHWNGGQGAEPGTIGLQDANGNLYGPWQASGTPGQGGAPNAYWTVNPNIVIPAGTYTVIDSDPDTWAQNDETGGAGMAWGSGIRQNNP
ncbi:MAG: hypothetical protein HYZ26_10430 [Chloroflexi bacterium]|nr:hypothetical protein [Chloroflexota bacterium]